MSVRAFVRRHDALVTSDMLSLSVAAASRLLSHLVHRARSRFLFDASASRHELLSESARPDACAL